jgi:BirA family transcriptional regulator, biotin operon repressor / biotin---[acetyl-CoA-carboxylase] ligase
MMRLDWDLIADALGESKHKLLCHIVVDKITSTNDWSLWSRGKNLVPAVCLAEEQVSGRGRNDRKWVSSVAENVYLSLVWPFTRFAENGLNGLSLIVGLVIARVLISFGVCDVKVKWPNDVLVKDKKIAGVLIETKVNRGAEIIAVIGIGVNYALSDLSRLEIGQPCTDVSSSCEGSSLPDRNQLAGVLIKELIQSCEVFQQYGFSAFIDEWNQYDACRGQEVSIHDATGVWVGKVIGLSNQCGLRILRDNAECVVYAADVSIRIK